MYLVGTRLEKAELKILTHLEALEVAAIIVVDETVLVVILDYTIKENSPWHLKKLKTATI